MEKKEKKLLVAYSFLCFLIICISSVFFQERLEFTNNLVLITFGINIVILVFSLLKENKLGYSSEEMIYIFLLFFMCLAPLVQAARKYFPWPDYILITEELIIKTNVIILIFLLTYKITKLLIYNRYKFKPKYIKNPKKVGDIMFYISIIISAVVIYKVGLQNLFSRSTNYIPGIGKSLSLIVNNTIVIFPVVTLIFFINYKKLYREHISQKKFYLLFFMTILINFPTGIPRFKMAVIYIAILVALKEKFNNKHIFKFMIIMGLIYIFPLINIFRYNSFSDIANFSLNIPNMNEEFLTGNFDSYSMLARSMIFTSENGIAMGTQLIGNLLFFIPRSLWSGKPVGSGAMMSEAFGWQFSNVSCPYIGEGIVNFGWIGVVIFAIILSYIITIATQYYELPEVKEISIIKLIYPFTLGFIFFIMRGDLMSSLSFFIGFSLPIIFLIVLDWILTIRVEV